MPVPVSKTNGTYQPNIDGEVHRIAPDLLPLRVQVGPLILDPKNSRKHLQPSIDGIKASLSRYGQQKTIVVRKGTNVVMAGNGTLEAVRQLGWTHIAANTVEMGDLEAMGYAIADNRTAELSEWDHHQLSSTIRSLKAAGESVEELGWTPDMLEVFLNADFSPPAVSDEQFGSTEEEADHAVWLKKEQYGTVQEALDAYREECGVQLEDGDCLEAICLEYLGTKVNL